MRIQAAPAAKPRTTATLVSLAAILVALAAAGCGSSSKSTSSLAPASTPSSSSASTATSATPAPSASSALKLAANPEGQLKFATSSLSAKAGTVTIEFTNAAPVPHNVTIASPSGAMAGATPTFQGGSKTLTVSLKPGTYKFYCSVPGHRAAGMEGTLTVH